jgi:hypothetical protein
MRDTNGDFMAKEVNVDRAAETRLRAMIGAAGLVVVLGANFAFTGGYISHLPTLSQSWRTSHCCFASSDLSKGQPIR